jgi:hypothetical protein
VRGDLEARSPQALAFARMPLSTPGVSVNKSAIFGAEVIVLKDPKPWMIVMENTARD